MLVRARAQDTCITLVCITPHHAKSGQAAHNVTSRDVWPRLITSRHDTQSHATPCHATPRHVTSRDVTSRHVRRTLTILHHITHPVTLHQNTWHHMAQRYVTRMHAAVDIRKVCHTCMHALICTLLHACSARIRTAYSCNMLCVHTYRRARTRAHARAGAQAPARVRAFARAWERGDSGGDWKRGGPRCPDGAGADPRAPRQGSHTRRTPYPHACAAYLHARACTYTGDRECRICKYRCL